MLPHQGAPVKRWPWDQEWLILFPQGQADLLLGWRADHPRPQMAASFQVCYAERGELRLQMSTAATPRPPGSVG